MMEAKTLGQHKRGKSGEKINSAEQIDSQEEEKISFTYDEKKVKFKEYDIYGTLITPNKANGYE